MVATWKRLNYRYEVLAVVALMLPALFFRPAVPGGQFLSGAVYGGSVALGTLAVVLTHRTDGFLNFGQIQLASTAGVLFLGLERGKVFEFGPVPHEVAFVACVIVALGAAGLFNMVLYRTVYQRFSKAPRLLLTLVSIFVGQALISVQGQLFGFLVSDDIQNSGKSGSPADVPGNFTFHVGPVAFQLGHIVILVAAITATAGLAAYLRFSSAGTAIRAAGENADRARTLGMDVPKVTSMAWLTAGLLAGIAGISDGLVKGYENGAKGAEAVTPQLPVSMLVIVLTAAVLAKFTSLTIALLASMSLGVLQQAVQWNSGSVDPLNAVLVLILGAALLLQRSGQVREKDTGAGFQAADEPRPIPPQLRELPAVQKWLRGGGALLAAVALGIPWLLKDGAILQLGAAVIFAIVGVSLLILTGWSGQISLGQFGFAAIGAWTTAVCGLPFPLALIAGGVAGAVAALVVGIPALKLHGLHLAVTSLAFALSAQVLFTGPRYLGKHLPDRVSRPNLLGVDLADETAMYYTLLVILALVCGAVIGLRRSRTGRVLIACRTNPAAAQSFGINLLRARLTAFAFSGFLAALAGGLLVYLQSRVNTASFSADESIRMLMFTVIGGLGSLAGPLLGFTVLAVFQLFGDNPVVKYAGAGVGAVILMLAVPGGLSQAAHAARDTLLRRLALRHRINVPGLLGEELSGVSKDQALLASRRRPDDEPPPVKYKLPRQWMLDRYGKPDATKERVGVRNS